MRPIASGGWLGALLLLAACSSTRDVWYQAGATQMQFKQDSYGCERDQPVIYCQGFACIDVNNRLKGMYRRCMESKGWERREEPK